MISNGKRTSYILFLILETSILLFLLYSELHNLLVIPSIVQKGKFWFPSSVTEGFFLLLGRGGYRALCIEMYNVILAFDIVAQIYATEPAIVPYG